VLEAKRPDEPLSEVVFERGAAVESVGALVALEGRLGRAVEDKEQEGVG
jgi:hypothetical protein